MNSIIKEKEYIKNTLGVPYENLSQSYLRSEVALTTTTGKISFTLQKNKKANALVTEKLLELNDEFVITHFTVNLKQIGADAPTDAQQGLAPLYTWEDPSTFSGTNAANVAALYNSNLTWTIDRREYIPSFDARRLRRVPDTQTGTDVGYASSGVNTVNGYPNGLYSYFPAEPTKIDGRQTIDLSLNLPTSYTFDDSSNTVYAVFMCLGYLVVNAKS